MASYMYSSNYHLSLSVAVYPPFVCLSVRSLVRLFVCLPFPMSLSVSLSVRPPSPYMAPYILGFICPCLCLSLCPSVFLYDPMMINCIIYFMVQLTICLSLFLSLCPSLSLSISASLPHCFFSPSDCLVFFYNIQ